MKKINKILSIYEWIGAIIFVQIIWQTGKLINPEVSSISLKLYTTLAAIFIYLPLRILILIFFPNNKDSEDTDE